MTRGWGLLILPALVLAAPPQARGDDAGAPPDSIGTASDAADSSLFRSPTARVEVRKPATWVFADLQTVMKQRATARLTDEDLDRYVKEHASAPLVAAMKHPEPYDDLNPSFQLLVRPAGALEGQSATAIMGMIETGLRGMLVDFKTVEPVRAIEVGGKNAARLTATYVVSNPEGREFPTRSTLVVIPEGKLLYQIGFSGPPEGADRLGDEIEEVLGSVTFLD
jgi:hypothetical protein